MTTWVPRSGLDSACGLVWLPRLLEKARRCELSAGARLIDGYCYGDNDFIDRMVIRFLRTDDTRISALVREYDSDEDVARILVEQSGRNPEECAAFSKKLRRNTANFILLEADEGRLSGPKASIVKFLYNRAMMPIVYRLFSRDESKRAASLP